MKIILRSSLVFACCLLLSTYLFGQDDKSYFATPTLGMDSIATLQLQEVTVFTKKNFESAEEERDFMRLKNRVIKVYPYVQIASQIYGQIETDLDSIGKKRKKNKYLKTTEKDVRAQFESEIRNLTRTEGRILVMLINRETGNNCYKLIKDLKSPIAAFFWNAIGKMYDYDLKAEYIAESNPDLEYIVKMLESGQQPR